MKDTGAEPPEVPLVVAGRGWVELRASSTSFSGESLENGRGVVVVPVLPRRTRPGPAPAGEDGRNFGDEPGLAGRPPPLLEVIGVKVEKAKLRRPDLPSLDVELIDALLPSRRCLRPPSGSCWGTRTIVNLLEEDREGFRFTEAC